MVGSCDVKFPIRLEGLAWSHGHFAQYEPELFPGLIYRMQLPKIVLLIFVSSIVLGELGGWSAPRWVGCIFTFLGSGGYGLHNKVYTDSPMSRLLTKPPPAASPPQPTNGSKDEELAPSSTPTRADKDEELQEIELQDDEL